MNWKEWYTKLKVGDRVKVIKNKEGCESCDLSCIEEYKQYSIPIIKSMDVISGIPYATIDDGNGQCGFPISHLKKVI